MSKDVYLAEEQMPQPISMDEGACFDLEEGLVEAGTALWASSSFPSSQARVTSVNSLSFFVGFKGKPTY